MEQNDKEKQFTSLIEEYKRVIYKICYMYATDGDNFKDLYQDVVINLWKGFEGYEGKGKPSSWIYRVGLNTCISFLSPAATPGRAYFLGFPLRFGSRR